MIHFDFDDRYQDENVVGSAISRRDGVMLSILVHAAIAALLIFGPQVSLLLSTPEELEAQRQEMLRRQKPPEDRTFVFVQPRVDLEARRAPEQAPLSDLNRQAQAPQIPPDARNPLPFAEGNSAERIEAAEAERARGEERATPPTEAPQPESQVARILPPEDQGLVRRPESDRPPVGALGEALRNLQRYVQKESFNNPQGGVDTPGASIQFDTKGVEFGPWIRRFVARVRRNWFIPQAAFTMRGHVVLQFNVHKDGRITDVAVVQPSAIDSFNVAAVNAIVGSSPVDPLPPEYPSNTAFFTVTFYYNEQPPGE